LVNFGFQKIHLKKHLFFIFLLIVFHLTISAQIVKKDSIPKGFLFGFGLGVSQPLGVLNERFTTGSKLNFNALYRTKNNLMIGFGAEQLFGSHLKDSTLFQTLKNDQGVFIDINGIPAAVIITGTGFIFKGNIGKLITFKDNKNSGIFCNLSMGFLQHKIKINVQETQVPGLHDEYLKGYDHLTNGLYTNCFIGYMFLARDGRFNFSLGLDYGLGFTKNRRNWNYDSNSFDNSLRLDHIMSIKLSYFFSLYLSDPEADNYF
jgi:hypothetical protein